MNETEKTVSCLSKDLTVGKTNKKSDKGKAGFILLKRLHESKEMTFSVH